MRRGKFIFLGGSVWLTLALILAWKSIADTSVLPTQEITSPTVASSPTSAPAPTSVPTPTESASPVPSSSPVVITVATDQNIVVKVPNQILVDPRAKNALIPQLYLNSPDTLLACIDSNQVTLDLPYPNNPNILISGNRTGHLLLSGSSADISQSLNSGNGSRAFTAGTGIAHASITIRTVALSKASLDGTFCSSALSSNTRTLSFAPLDLALSITKSSVRVK